MAKKKFKLFSRNRIIIPAQYGTIERRVVYDDGTIETSTEQVVLRQAVDMPKGLADALVYETRSERILIEKAKDAIVDGQKVLISAKYKTVTKQVIKKVNRLPPQTGVKLIKFFAKRSVRHEIIQELKDDYQEEQLFEFGIFGANLWYWKEVIVLLGGALLSSPFQRFIPKTD